jgi:hypothetical protein
MRGGATIVLMVGVKNVKNDGKDPDAFLITPMVVMAMIMVM